jgi:cytochrome bd-type quinol oxidase subunit 2
MNVLDIALWYGNLAALITVLEGLCFAYLYETRTNGAWRKTEMGRHLMWFVLAPTSVLLLALIRVIFGASLDTLWFVILRLVVFTSVPVVYFQRIWIFLKVQKESDDSDQDH